ncbi:MAG: DUF885 domain-containing protein, partial [Saprospiraceae bacterium]|nr:DUF885 domain-containing protein [Saprospiraceae bacterium]
MRLPVLLFLTIACLQACQNNPSNPSNASNPSNPSNPSNAIDSLFATYHRERAPFYPLESTFAGERKYNDLLPNTNTQEYRRQLRTFYQKYQTLLKAYKPASLTPNQRMSYDILFWECEVNLHQLEFPTELMPINQFDCIPLMMGQLAGGTSGQPFKTVEDYDLWLRRVDQFVIWCDTAIANMRRGMDAGYVLPKTLTEKMIPQWQSFAHGRAEKHHYYGPITLMPEDFPATEQQRIKETYLAMITEKIIPVYHRMHQFLVKEYLPASKASSGIADIPDGKAYYDHQIRIYTTTTMSADDIFTLGEKEVARLSAEMEKVKVAVGFTGDLKSFFDHVRTRKELMPFTQPQQVIDHFNQVHDRMKPQLSKLFDLTPKTPFVVKRTEAFREATAAPEYVQGTLDGSRPGTFYVPIPKAREYNMFADEDLFLHEAIPGHHYQISLQQENTQLPDFRRTLWYSAYGEGWALYTESLGKELGLY